MNKFLIVFKYELKTILKSKAYILLNVILIGLILIIPTLIGVFARFDNGSSNVEEYFVYDPSGLIDEEVYEPILGGDIIKVNSIGELNKNGYEIQQNKIIIHEDYKNPSNPETNEFIILIQSISKTQELLNVGLTEEQIIGMIKPSYQVEIKNDHTSEKNDQGVTVILSFISIMIIFMIINIGGSILSESIVKEKNNRLYEIMSSLVSPNKIIGSKVAATSVSLSITLLLIFISIVIGGLIFDLLVENSVSNLLIILELDIKTIIFEIITPIIIMGWIYITMFASVMSIFASNSKEGESSNQVLIIPVILLVISLYVVMFGDSILHITKYIPFFSPFAVIALIGKQVISMPEIAYLILLNILYILSTIYLAGKVFKYTLLNYGQKSKLLKLISQKKNK